ncbi:hypothetical protein [Nostoc sp. CCY0012]
MSIRMLPAGHQVLIVTFCVAAHFTPAMEEGLIDANPFAAMKIKAPLGAK